MRKGPTRNEARLWRWLRDRRFSDYKFRRQHPLGPFILDFYCPELKLGIEVDGKHHQTPWMNEYDTSRDELLSSKGIEVLRIPNELFKQDTRFGEEWIRLAISRIAAKR